MGRSAAVGASGWVAGKRGKFLPGGNVRCGGRLRPPAGPAPPTASPVQLLPLFWAARVLSWAESRAHGAPCAGFWEAVPALLFLMLSEPALPELPCVLGRLHTVLPALFSKGSIYLMESYVNGDANWIQPRGAWPASRLCSLLENCTLLLQGKLSSTSFLLFPL